MAEKRPTKEDLKEVRRGRPTKFTPTIGDEITYWMGQGFSLTGAAGKVKTCAETVHRWARENPDFRLALNRARAASAAWWEQRAAEHSVDGQGSASVIIFALKNRVAGEWRDKREHDLTSSDGSMTPKAIERRVVRPKEDASGKGSGEDG